MIVDNYMDPNGSSEGAGLGCISNRLPSRNLMSTLAAEAMYMCPDLMETCKLRIGSVIIKPQTSPRKATPRVLIDTDHETVSY